MSGTSSLYIRFPTPKLTSIIRAPQPSSGWRTAFAPQAPGSTSSLGSSSYLNTAHAVVHRWRRPTGGRATPSGTSSACMRCTISDERTGFARSAHRVGASIEFCRSHSLSCRRRRRSLSLGSGLRVTTGPCEARVYEAEGSRSLHQRAPALARFASKCQALPL